MSNWCQHLNTYFAIKTCSARSGNLLVSLLGIPRHAHDIASLYRPASFAVVKFLAINFTFGEFLKRPIHSFQLLISRGLKKLLRDTFEK